MNGTCYAKHLGDCAGKIEDEHIIPQAIQKMCGPVTLRGLRWQGESTSGLLPPKSYAHSRILCRKHHDELDGLDGNALAFFRNWVLIVGQMHPTTGVVGRLDEIKPVIDGRALERWFLKTICGLIYAEQIDNPTGPTSVPGCGWRHCSGA